MSDINILAAMKRHEIIDLMNVRIDCVLLTRLLLIILLLSHMGIAIDIDDSCTNFDRYGDVRMPIINAVSIGIDVSDVVRNRLNGYYDRRLSR